MNEKQKINIHFAEIGGVQVIMVNGTSVSNEEELNSKVNSIIEAYAQEVAKKAVENIGEDLPIDISNECKYTLENNEESLVFTYEELDNAIQMIVEQKLRELEGGKS